MMHQVRLILSTPESTLLEMNDWCKEWDGYVGETEFVITDGYTIKFHHSAFLPSAEDCAAFRLRFGV